MWNQVSCAGLSVHTPSPFISVHIFTTVVLLIRTYAFFNRNKYVLFFLISALAGLVAYQIYVDASQMLRTFALVLPR